MACPTSEDRRIGDIARDVVTLCRFGLILLGLGLSQSLYGAGTQQTDQVVENAGTEATETDENMPDLEFLEFLGSFETDNGDWINPDRLADNDFDALLNAARQAQQAGGQENPDDGDSNEPDSC